MTNAKEKAINELDNLKGGLSFGSGKRAESIDDAAAPMQKTTGFGPDLKFFKGEEYRKMAQNQIWITLGIVVLAAAVIIGLIKYKVIKL